MITDQLFDQNNRFRLILFWSNNWSVYVEEKWETDDQVAFSFSPLLYVQEVVTCILNSNLLYKMGHYFLDTQYVSALN